MSRRDSQEKMMGDIEAIVKEVLKQAKETRGPGGMEDLERLVEGGGREIMRKLFEMTVGEWTKVHGGEAKRCGCGRDNNKGKREREILTHWGIIRLRREYRRCDRCDHSSFAGDRELGVERDMVSPRLRQTVTLLGTVMAYEQVPEVLWHGFGLKMTAEQVKRVTQGVGADAVRMEEQERPIKRESGVRNEGEWYFMIDASSVNTVEGWKDVRNAVFRSRNGEETRYVVDLISYEEFGGHLRRYGGSLGIKETSDVIALADGLEANWKLIRVNFPGAREILDFYHAAEKIWETGRVVYGEGTERCRGWSEEECRRLKELGPGPLLKQMEKRTPRQKEEKKRASLETLARYVRTNESRMNYPQYIREGLLIGSGPVESACKGVTGARLRGTGMRWTVENVRRMGHLRAIYKSGLWSELWKQRRLALAA